VGKASKLEKAVGRLIVGKLGGHELDADTAQALTAGTIGGITLFKENARDLEQLVDLIASIHQQAIQPPLIAVDQEGGAVQRFAHLLTPLPAAMALAAQADLERVQMLAELSASQLRLLGVNCVLAPVLDVVSNPLNPIVATRSFGDDPQLVAKLGGIVSQAIRDAGLLSVGKHFPGHGATIEDSHSQLAVNESDARLLWRRELAPFRGCLDKLSAVLTGHIWLPAVDQQTLPASLSARVTSGLLRHYLGFQGLVMTDDLMMKGVSDRWGIEEAAVRAVLAGADVLLICGGIAQVRSAHRAIIEAVQSGRIEEMQIQAAAARVERHLTALRPAPRRGAGARAAREKRLAMLAQRVKAGEELVLSSSASSVGLLRGAVPELASGDWTIVAPKHPSYGMHLSDYLRERLATKLEQGELSLQETRYSLSPAPEEALAIAQQCRERSCIFLTYRTLINEGQILLGRALSESSCMRASVATDSPFDLIGLPNWDHCLATFDPSDLAMQALSMVLAGQIEPAGICPVSLQMRI